MDCPRPRRGGYEFEVVEPGPPTYFAAPPAGAGRGALVPVGDGEGLPSRHATPAVPEEPEPGGDPGLDFEAPFQLGLARHAQKAFDAAVTLLGRAVGAARRANDPRLSAVALHALSVALRDAGRAEDALARTEEAGRLAVAAGDRRVLGRALVEQGTLLRRLGRFEEAAAVLEQAVGVVGGV